MKYFSIRASVLCMDRHSSVRDTSVKASVRLPMYSDTFASPYFKEYILSFHDVSFLITFLQG